MCGISGVVSFAPLAITDFEAVARVNAALFHRGPNGVGEFRDEHVMLAMRRLSIIDLDGAWQPLFNEDRSLALVANGEIYNYLELRRELTERGHRFATNGDCETILHLYEEYGPRCVEKLRGMIAFALWDCRRQRLILARDRMGEKPLYLYESDGRLVFASELRALLRSGVVPFALNADAVDMFLHYTYVPEPLTPIEGVRKLDAGTLLIVDVRSHEIVEHRYWNMEDAPPIEDNPTERIRVELDRVSDLVIRSDVPVGVALSGGLDSSAIACLAVKKYPDVMHAFSIGYEGAPECDEREDARALADHLGMPFHAAALRTEEMVRDFPRVVFERDDPIADISGYGYWSVARMAREHSVPVLLQGQGGDELFWGYRWVRQAAHESIIKERSRFAGSLPRLLSYLTPHAPSSLRKRDLLNWMREGFGLRHGARRWRNGSRAHSDRLVFYDLASEFRAAASERDRIYTPAFLERLAHHDAASLFTVAQPWPDIPLRITRLIMDTYLRENGIAQGDRLSMAASVELRLPLVDYRLVETVIGLRKVHSDLALEPKTWFREALHGIVPDFVLRRPKRGFTPPTHLWRRTLLDAFEKSLSDGYLASEGIIDPQWLRRSRHGGLTNRREVSLAFNLLVLEVWCATMTGSMPVSAGETAHQLVA